MFLLSLSGLIVAVMDKQRLKLKIMYTQKKKITRQMSENNSRMEVMQVRFLIISWSFLRDFITNNQLKIPDTKPK